MTCGVYGIFSYLNDECLYVGQSSNVEARLRQHVYKLKGKRKSALTDFVNWYHNNGALESLLRFEILEQCENVDLDKNKAEAYWFDELQPRFYGKVPSLSERWSHSDSTRSAIQKALQKHYGCLCNSDAQCPRHSLKCEFCKSVFISKRSQRFCSVNCRGKNSSAASRISKDKLKHLYFEEKLTPTEIGAIYGVTDITVGNLLADYGLKVRNSAKQFEEALKRIEKSSIESIYVEQRKTVKSTAKELSISPSILEKLMDHYGILRRDPREAQVRPTRLDYLRKQIDKPTLHRLYEEEGLSAKRIGYLYAQPNGQGVKSLLLEYGITPR